MARIKTSIETLVCPAQGLDSYANQNPGTHQNVKFPARLPSIVFCLALFSNCLSSNAQDSGAVPSLPTQPFDYVGYAVSNLPYYYLPPTDTGESNNTPEDNPITNDGATLGRVLFYDNRLSLNHSISCASCHTQRTGFGDVRRYSIGYSGLPTARHSMTLTNAVFYISGRFRWDESAKTLEAQCLIPIQAEDEMGLTLDELRARLSDAPFYPPLFENAFGDPDVTDERIAKALAQFVRSMVSYNSKYDLALKSGTPGEPNFEKFFNESELLGQRLFEATPDSVGCYQCHRSQAQIGFEPHNIGLDLKNKDKGAGNGRFKTTSLRNVAVRGRFMHDGRFESLHDVIEFYDSGVQPNPDLDGFLLDKKGMPVRLNLSQKEKRALVDFLHTLTDEQFLNAALFSDPFQTPEVLLGDVNLDGRVNSADISPFVDRLTNGIYQPEADVNQDQRLDFHDIQPFVELLL